jgi:hypothetical protein
MSLKSAAITGLPLRIAHPWSMTFLIRIVFLTAVITGSDGFPPPDATVALAAKQKDNSDRNFNASVHPYPEEPLKSLIKRIPELKGLRPEANQQALPMILEMSGERVDEFFHNVVDVLAQEEIAQERLDGTGAIEAKELVQDNYLILRHRQARGASIDEYRMDKKGNRMDRVGLDQGFFVTSGFALSCNYFSTAFQSESMFRYLGDQTMGQRDSYVVAFAQKPGKATLFVTMAERGGARAHMLMQGIIWVEKSDLQIIQMRMDLLNPHPEIRLEHLTTIVTLDKVQLLEVAAPLWLPTRAKVYLRFREVYPDRGQSHEVGFRNEHRYADYRRYRVSVKINPPQ